MVAPTYAWTFEGDPTVNAMDAADATQELTFDAAGAFRVEVSATDDAGNTVSTGILLQVFDATSSTVIGDVDDDGAITAADGTMVRDRVEGAALLSPEEYARADVDLDGVVTALDATLIEGAVGELAPTYLSADSGSFGKRLLPDSHPHMLAPGGGDHRSVRRCGTDGAVSGRAGLRGLPRTGRAVGGRDVYRCPRRWRRCGDARVHGGGRTRFRRPTVPTRSL